MPRCRTIFSTTALFFILFTLLPVTPRTTSAAEVVQTPEVTIFIYHRFGEDKYPTTNVSMEKFKEQMAYLLANNYQVISLKRLVRLLKNEERFPDKTAVITIDDGYKSIYSKAWPVLKSFGFQFTVFLYIQATDNNYSNFLNWDEIKEMHEAGVDFQDHSYSHKRMGHRPADLDEQAYRSWISADLVKSSRIMMEKLGYRPRFLALPYGEYNTIVLEEAKALGYEAIFSQDPGSVSEHTDPYLIPREPILGETWSTIKHFEMVLNRVDLPLTDMHPSLEPLTDMQPEVFSARILKPELYRSNSYEIYVSELGWKRAEFDGATASIKNNKKLTRAQNRVIVRAREKKGGRIALRSWLLMKEVKE